MPQTPGLWGLGTTILLRDYTSFTGETLLVSGISIYFPGINAGRRQAIILY